MELKFNFKYGNVNMSHSAIVSDELSETEHDSLWTLVAIINDSLAMVTRILNEGNSETVEEPPYADTICDVCGDEFKSPAGLKQHKTVKGHYDEG